MTTPAPDDLIVPPSRIVRHRQDLAVVDLSAYEFQPLCDMCPPKTHVSKAARASWTGVCGKPATHAIRTNHCAAYACRESDDPERRNAPCAPHWHFSCDPDGHDFRQYWNYYFEVHHKPGTRSRCWYCREIIRGVHETFIESRPL